MIATAVKVETEVRAPERRAWRQVLLQLDAATTHYLQEHPAALCPEGCSECCQHAAPLVSDVEFALIEQALGPLDEGIRTAVELRARELRARLEQGEGDDFACPLLVEGRCLVHEARPYLCRSFGHSARRVDGSVRVFSCRHLHKSCVKRPPPVLEFRITALRRVLGRVVDSYLPIWLSTEAGQRKRVCTAEDRAVVVASPKARVYDGDAQSP